MDQKQIARNLEYVRYSFYALSMSCYVLVGGLEYNNVLSGRTALGLCVAIFCMGWPGRRALRKLEKSASSDDESETNTIEALNEGSIR